MYHTVRKKMSEPFMPQVVEASWSYIRQHTSSSATSKSLGCKWWHPKKCHETCVGDQQGSWNTLKAPLLKWKSGRRFVSWHNVGDRLSAAKCRTLACSQPMCSQSSFCRNLPQIKEDSKDAQHTTSRHKDANDNVSMKMVISHQSTHFSCFASKPKSILASVLCSSFNWEPHELLGYWQLTHLLHKQFHTSVPLCDWLLKWGLTAFMGTLEKRS